MNELPKGYRFASLPVIYVTDARNVTKKNIVSFLKRDENGRSVKSTLKELPTDKDFAVRAFYAIAGGASRSSYVSRVNPLDAPLFLDNLQGNEYFEGVCVQELERQKLGKDSDLEDMRKKIQRRRRSAA